MDVVPRAILFEGWLTDHFLLNAVSGRSLLLLLDGLLALPT